MGRKSTNTAHCRRALTPSSGRSFSGVPAGPPPVNRKLAYATTLVSFAAKGVFAFVITYLVANHLSKEQYGHWATLFSIAIVLGISELGVGQLILTTFHERRVSREEADRLISNSVAAMLVLSIVLQVGFSLAFAWSAMLPGVSWGGLLVAIILLRLITVPHGAYLMALERFHERKLAEALSYAAAAGFVAWGVARQASFSVLLLGMNAILTLGTLGVMVRARILGIPRIHWKSVTLPELRRVFGSSFPYFVTNVSSLTTYAGFIAMSSLVLNPLELARLSLLHTLLLMHAMQVFELLFKSVQTRMGEPGMMGKLTRLVGLAYLASLVGSVLAGPWIITRIFPKYHYSPVELSVYTTFVFLEVFYLMITTAVQMQSSLKQGLQNVSLIKAAAFGVLLLIAGLLPQQPGVLFYAVLLVVYSAAMGLLAWNLGRHRSAGLPPQTGPATDPPATPAGWK